MPIKKPTSGEHTHSNPQGYKKKQLFHKIYGNRDLLPVPALVFNKIF